MDNGAQSNGATSIAIDLALVALFGVQRDARSARRTSAIARGHRCFPGDVESQQWA